MKNTLARFEEHEAQLQKRIDDKMHEVTQLTAMLEQVYRYRVYYQVITGIRFIPKYTIIKMNN